MGEREGSSVFGGRASVGVSRTNLGEKFSSKNGNHFQVS